MNDVLNVLREYIYTFAHNYHPTRQLSVPELSYKISIANNRIRKELDKAVKDLRGMEPKRSYLEAVHTDLADLDYHLGNIPDEYSFLRMAVAHMTDYLYQNYHTTIDRNWHVNQAYLSYVLAKLHKNVAIIKKATEDANVESKLAKIVVSYLEQKGFKIVTYKDLEYYQLVIDRLYSKCVTNINIQAVIIQALIYLNFNTCDFITYYLERYVQSTDEGWNFQAAERETRLWLKDIARTRQRPGTSYDNAEKSLCEHATDLVLAHRKYNWDRLKDEDLVILPKTQIEKYEKALEMNDKWLEAVEKNSENALKLKSNPKVTLFFMRIIAEIGCYTIDNKTGFFFFIARLITSDEPDKKSLKYLRDQYSLVHNQKPIVNEVLVMLENSVDLIKRNYLNKS